MVCRRKSLYLQVETKCLIEKNKIDMREKIEALMAEIAGLKNLKEQEIEALRVRLLGKKGEITALFDEFRTVAETQCAQTGCNFQNRGTEVIRRIRGCSEQACRGLQSPRGYRGFGLTPPGVHRKGGNHQDFPQIRLRCRRRS